MSSPGVSNEGKGRGGWRVMGTPPEEGLSLPRNAFQRQGRPRGALKDE